VEQYHFLREKPNSKIQIPGPRIHTKSPLNFEFETLNLGLSKNHLSLSWLWQVIAGAVAVIAQSVERQLPKLKVAGSRPVYRSGKKR
jgi:hypothetical protein